LEEFRKRVPGKCDAILMDPPFEYNGWTVKEFEGFMEALVPTLEKCFLVCWADPEYLLGVIRVFVCVGLKFCDSMFVELLDGYGRPRDVKDYGEGWPRSSRLALIFRTRDITESDFSPALVRSMGFGIVALKGKTYGRMSMPLTLHNILELMLPEDENGKKVFVELWPNFFDRRHGWVLIDEASPLPEEPQEVEDEGFQTEDQKRLSRFGKRKAASSQREPADQPKGAKAPPPTMGQQVPKHPMATRSSDGSRAGGFRPGVGGSGQTDTRVARSHPSKT
jgi:hypothetical protein